MELLSSAWPEMELSTSVVARDGEDFGEVWSILSFTKSPYLKVNDGSQPVTHRQKDFSRLLGDLLRRYIGPGLLSAAGSKSIGWRNWGRTGWKKEVTNE
ncbi:hypothetical protein L1887_11048 [Cichorium endivia]|nr:hypothetical protein L1887_11048 [Cichorium endivia]